MLCSRKYIISGLLFCLLFLQAGRLLAQNYTLGIHPVDSMPPEVQQTLQQKTSFASSAELLAYISKIVPDLQAQGYLAASVDSIGVSIGHYDAFVYAGKRHRWSRVYFDAIPAALLVDANVNPLQWSNRKLDPREIARITERMLSYCDDNGYPFARVWLGDIMEESDGVLQARFMIDRGKLRHIDSIGIKGDVRISRNYLMRYLELPQGCLYSEKKLRNISRRIRELPFLQELAPWSITFKTGSTRLNLLLKEKKANQLNAILGLMPNNLQTGKLLLTADVQLALQNILGHGESFNVTYQNLQYRSPRMKADLIWPYLANTPVGTEAHFDFFRNDLQFRRVTFQAGLRYQINAADYVRLYYQVQSNRVIQADTATVLATHQLPANIDATASGGGLELSVNRTDYRINPHKGWQVRVNTTALLRKILANNAITGLNDGSGFNFASLYDTVAGRSYQYYFTGDAAAYIPLARQVTLKVAWYGGYIASKTLFQNELFQLGGFKLLRGFDEQSIYANLYQVATIELRLLLSQNSYAYIFSDNGYVQTKFSNYDRQGMYNGFGVGTTLETKTGLFSIAYALGRSDNIQLKFRESKILFGYVAYF